MSIPEDWLVRRITLAEVEEELPVGGPPEIWLRHWRSFLDKFAPGDELWEYQGAVYASPESESVGGVIEDHAGFALVRGSKVLDSVEAPWLA
jgi:hypothetical protein